MKRIHLFVFLLLLSSLPSRPSYGQATPASEDAYVHVPLNLSFVPPISIGTMVANAAGKDGVVNAVSFNLVAGYAARLDGVEFGGVWNGYREGVRGAQFAGVANTAGGPVNGAQFAGVANVVGEASTAAQFAGVANVVDGALGGAQFAGVVNAVRGDVRGVQAAGAVNVATGRLRGAQLGVVNAARHAVGLQLGVVNVAATSTGVPVGLFSFVKDVGLRFDVWADETGFVQVAVRSGNRRVANFIGAGVRAAGGEEGRFAVVTGLGYEHPLSRRAFAAVDGLAYQLFEDDFGGESVLLNRLRLTAGVRLTDHLAAYAGPSVNVLLASDGDAGDYTPYEPLATFGDDVEGAIWIGFSAGLRLYARP